MNQWHGCYDDRWGNEITPEAVAHPAKFSRGLIRRIYQEALAQGWLTPGDTVLDPFGGVGLGARDALANGLNWVGVELEPRFVDLGAGCACPGLARADYVRFYGRWSQVNHRHGHHWCPACLAQAGQIAEPAPPVLPYSRQKRRGRITDLQQTLAERGVKFRRVELGQPLPLPGRNQTTVEQLPLFKATPPELIYRRKGQIPHNRPHDYQGNLDRFRRYAKAGAWAILLQGDSRDLIEVLGQIGGILSSPPYAGARIAETGGKDSVENSINRSTSSKRYGETPGQIGIMPEGSLKAAITSPMFAGNSGGTGEASRQGIDPALFDRHRGGINGGISQTEGNLGGLPLKGFEAVIDSPPYTSGEKGHPSLGSTNKDDWGQDGRDIAHRRGVNGNYGQTPGQLTAFSEGSLDAAITSAPYTESVGSDDPDKRGGLYRDPKRRNDRSLTAEYGATPGQLGAMAEGVLSSPPYEKGNEGGREIFNQLEEKYYRVFTDRSGRKSGYQLNEQQTPGNLGCDSGETFWSAALKIVSQTYQVLKPDGIAIWVCKDFVRDGQRVPFCDQWRQLCQACGFEPVRNYRAMLVREKGTQVDLDGAAVKLTVERKSFFRRLAEKNGAPRIDWEEVIVMRKPA